MPDQKTRRVEHRIVSLHQPHVRPIVRGKAGHETEFGAKLTAGLADGYTRNCNYDFDGRLIRGKQVAARILVFSFPAIPWSIYKDENNEIYRGGQRHSRLRFNRL